MGLVNILFYNFRKVKKMDYFFYRVHLYFKKKNYAPVMMGINNVTVLHICSAFFIAMVIRPIIIKYLHYDLSKAGNLKVVAYSTFALFFLFNVIRYSNKNRVKTIILKYKNHKFNKTIKTWQIFLLPYFIFFLSIFCVKLLNIILK